MSGLGDAHRRVSCSFRQQPCAPRMRACQRNHALGARDLGRGRHAQRTRDDRLIRERPTVVGHPPRPIHSVFDDDVDRPDIAPHRIELPVVGHRPVTAQAPGGREAQDPGQISARWLRPMQIGGLGRRDREALIVDP